MKFDILTIKTKNYSKRPNPSIKAIILHCIGTKIEDLFELLNKSGASTHYLVPQLLGKTLQKKMQKEFGNQKLNFPNKVPVIRLVDDSYTAFHAGKSSFASFNKNTACEEGLNNCSIGIEFHCPGYVGIEYHTKGYKRKNGQNWYKFASFKKKQIETGIDLISYLTKLHNIPKENLLAHSTIAPSRKTDPGPLFFWKKLFNSGFGYIPKPKKKNLSPEDILLIQKKLIEIGFNNCPQTGDFDDLTKDHIDSFIMQFAPDLWKERHNKVTHELLEFLEGFNHKY